ncbi:MULTISPECIES: class I SAM-dependent methyltransferase [unclassified Lysinibacillus]|uniref:class I SAM-dependent methyltransferase n=1 Tax=unclassified Lysinibacillus TaxID=2636778 RepID=UPI003829ED12
MIFIKKWEIIDDNIVLCDRESGKLTNLKHSKIVRKKLTYKYWDYLAWAVATIPNNRVLSIGFGAGTFVQLLEKWGAHSSGVGLEIDDSFDDFNKLYANYDVIYGDFRNTLQSVHSDYDTIIVDVYNEQGYVEEAYDSVWIEKYLSLKKKDGIVILHCLDILGTLTAADISVPKVSTILNSLISSVRKLTNEEIYIVPLWTSYLLWIGPVPRRIDTNVEELNWLDKFFRLRLCQVDILNNDLPVLDTPWSYQRINQVNSSIVESLKELDYSEYDKYSNLIKILSNVLQKEPTIDEINMSIDMLENLNIGANPKIHLYSFLLAMKEEWVNAENVLDDNKLTIHI